MDERRRYIETVTFGKPDRIPLAPGGGRKSTRERWRREGLPGDVENVVEFAYRQAGGTLDWPDVSRYEHFSVNERMIPQFEEKIVERCERTLIVQDWKGNVCEISDEYGVEYLREAIDFVTRKWIKCPVESREDWKDMKRRYDADDASRLPVDAKGLGKRLDNRDWFVGLHFNGPFWQLREWLGFENLCMMFHDDPAFVREMIEFWTEYIARLLERAFECTTFDEVHLSEDMAYKCFSMISPAMVREFLLPTYNRWGQIIRGAGVPIYAMDSDGYIGELIPIWIEAGISKCDPIEVAAGNDIVEFRRQFGKDMAFSGGVDKRAIAAGGKTIEDEVNRIRPVVEDGGYIPGCDHGVPSDVSWPNFVRYTGLLAEMTGWM